MRLGLASYKKYILNLKSKIKDQSIFSPVLLNNETIIFPFERFKNNYLVISLNNNSPLLYLVENENFFSSFESYKFLQLKREIKKTIIKDIYLNENDFIVSIYLENIETGKTINLICELISKKPDLLLIENELIKISFLGKHELQTRYFFPQRTLDFKQENSLSDDDIKTHFENEIVIRKKQKYSAFTKFLTAKVKSINKKITQINNDVLVANENLKCEEFANEIFTLGYNLKGHYDSVCLNDRCIKLDESKTLLENIEKLYKKSKKAKETIKRSQININNAKNELNEYEEILNKFKNSSEKEADKLVELYGKKNKKKEIAKTTFNRPYSINLNGTYFYFGRNASQNDYLSFVMKLDRDFTWLHIKDLSGSHIVICNKKPTENEILFACEIALICSKVSTAEVVYTKKKNVRRGHTLGEAILKNYSTIKINSIRKESFDLFALAKRVD